MKLAASRSYRSAAELDYDNHPDDHQICHIDVGYSRSVASVLGIQPTTLILCGAKDGLTIRDDRTAIKSQGGVPAACNCGACRAIAAIMHQEDVDPQVARRIYTRRHHD